MCGIAGLYTKSDSQRPELGALLAGMLEQLIFRGPDSAGVAFYREPAPAGSCKLSLHSAADDPGWEALGAELGDVFGAASPPRVRASHAVFVVEADAPAVQAWLGAEHPELTLMSAGSSIEIFKAAGSPIDFVERFRISEIDGSHALGHTRMAT